MSRVLRMRFERKELWLGVAGLLLLVGGLLIALPFVVQARGTGGGGAGRRPLAADASLASSATSSAGAASSHVASVAPVSALSTASSSAPTTTIAAVPAPAMAPAPSTVAPAPPASSAPSLEAYRGLGSWVDIYDTRAWRNPGAAVADMAQHGAKTLYLETSNSRSAFALKDPASMSVFVQAAHSHGMKIVAWYLPDTTKPNTDYYRIAAAIGFRTADGQKFDSFALDIESSAIKSESARNRALGALSSRIRSLVGASYPLGAIIPSPAGLAKKMGYWNDFPYAAVAQKYDVFVPMSYYTYHGKTAASAYADTRANVRIIRAQKGCSRIPIHLIGGLAENSSAGQLDSFVRAAREAGCIGASFYEWAGTTAADWQQLKAITP